jgi:hypothetical protein
MFPFELAVDMRVGAERVTEAEHGAAHVGLRIRSAAARMVVIELAIAPEACRVVDRDAVAGRARRSGVVLRIGQRRCRSRRRIHRAGRRRGVRGCRSDGRRGLIRLQLVHLRLQRADLCAQCIELLAQAFIVRTRGQGGHQTERKRGHRQRGSLHGTYLQKNQFVPVTSRAGSAVSLAGS